jgi:hypothetical protein
VDGIVVHPESGERRQFEKRAAGIEQTHDAIAGQKLAPREVAFPGPWQTALRGLRAAALQFVRESAHARGISSELP